jgi:three-Cys-motif partner protein
MARTSKMRTNPLVAAEADGLKTTPIGRWALDKYRLVSLYCQLFSTGMKDKWPNRIYTDLYAGSGFSEIEGTNLRYFGSPLLALAVANPFNRYVLCEQDDFSLQALRKRVDRLFPHADVRFVPGDCNERIGEITEKIPREPGVLSFCFVDPFDLSIKFSTIRRMAVFRTDFLFVLALHMDANRNVSNYTRSDNHKIDDFLGLSDWRIKWQEAELRGISFARFLAELFSKQMETLRYLPVPFYRMKQIRSDENLPLYHLALFSRHQRAYLYWDQVLKYSTDQPSLFSEPA